MVASSARPKGVAPGGEPESKRRARVEVEAEAVTSQKSLVVGLVVGNPSDP